MYTLELVYHRKMVKNISCGALRPNDKKLGLTVTSMFNIITMTILLLIILSSADVGCCAYELRLTVVPQKLIKITIFLLHSYLYSCFHLLLVALISSRTKRFRHRLPVGNIKFSGESIKAEAISLYLLTFCEMIGIVARSSDGVKNTESRLRMSLN